MSRILNGYKVSGANMGCSTDKTVRNVIIALVIIIACTILLVGLFFEPADAYKGLQWYF